MHALLTLLPGLDTAAQTVALLDTLQRLTAHATPITGPGPGPGYTPARAARSATASTLSAATCDLVLDEADIEEPVVFEEEGGTSSRLHPLERPKFGDLLTYARPGDTVHISEMFRLVRGTQHILDVLDVLHQGRLALRIHDGPGVLAQTPAAK